MREPKTKSIQDLAFMLDVTDHLQFLNKGLLGGHEVATHIFDAILAFNFNYFEGLLELNLTEMQERNPWTHMLCQFCHLHRNVSRVAQNTTFCRCGFRYGNGKY